MRIILISTLRISLRLCGQSFSNGLSADPSYFPIAVWLQDAENIANYQAIGINMYVGLWNGPTQTQLQALKTADMSVICDQNSYALANLSTYGRVIKGWMQGDEPDNAQWNEATQTYDPCIDTSVVQADYAAWRTQDTTRPVFLNLGQGVAYISYIGRGACSGNTRLYPGYLRGCDIVSYDIYPVNSEYAQVRDSLWYVPKGVDSLRRWGNDTKPVWCWIECTAINANQKPTPAQVKAEVWMALIHGARGFGYFCHSWYPFFAEAALLADPEMKDSVATINVQVRSLAPALNSPDAVNAVFVASSNTAVPVDVLTKIHGDSLYVFAAAMRGEATNATFTLNNGSRGSEVDVIGESRTLILSGNSFTDAFGGYGVHLYRIWNTSTSGETMLIPVREKRTVRFEIYDVRGRLVGSIKGRYDGSDGFPQFAAMEQNLPNGIYLCRISGNGVKVATIRVVIR